MSDEICESMHELRKQIDACIKEAEQRKLAGRMPHGRELALVITKLQEAKMWGGKCLEVLGSELPEEYRDESTPAEDFAKAPAGEEGDEARKQASEEACTPSEDDCTVSEHDE